MEISSADEFLAPVRIQPDKRVFSGEKKIVADRQPFRVIQPSEPTAQIAAAPVTVVQTRIVYLLPAWCQSAISSVLMRLDAPA